MKPFIPKVPLSYRWASIERARSKGRKGKSIINVLGRNTRRFKSKLNDGKEIING